MQSWTISLFGQIGKEVNIAVFRSLVDVRDIFRTFGDGQIGNNKLLQLGNERIELVIRHVKLAGFH